MKSWTNKGTWAALLCCVGLACCVGMAYAGRPDNPAEPADRDLIPNWLLVAQCDSTGDAYPIPLLCTKPSGPDGPLSRRRRSKPRRGETSGGPSSWTTSRTATSTARSRLRCERTKGLASLLREPQRAGLCVQTTRRPDWPPMRSISFRSSREQRPTPIIQTFVLGDRVSSRGQGGLMR